MARAHEIAIGADAKDFDRGIREGVIKPLGDAEEALEDLERAAKSADLDQEIEKAQKSTNKFEAEIDDANDSLRKLGRSARDAGDDTKRGMKGAEDGVKEMGDEAQSTAKEAAASFDGSAESILDAFQEVAANAFAGFGPAGALAGLAIAAGVGIAVGKFQEAEEAAEELRQKSIEYADDAREAGVSTDVWVTSAARIVERIKELEETKSTDFRWFWEEDPSKLEKWTEALEVMGRGADEVDTVLKASNDTLQDYTNSLKDSQDALKDEIDLRRETVDVTNEAEVAKTDALVKEYEAHQEVLDQLAEETGLRAEAKDSSERQSAAGIDAAAALAQAEEEKAERIASAEQVVQDSVTAAYDSMRDAATTFATTEDGALDINRWLTYTQEHAAAVATYQSNLQAMKLSPDQWSNLMEMPEDARMQWVAQFAALPEEARAPYSAALNDLGSSGGSSAAVAFDDSFNPNADVEIQVETDRARSDLDDVAKDRTAEIKVKTTGKADAKSDLDALARTRHATINVRADVSDANAAINTMRRNQEARPITITANVRSGRTQLV